MHPVGRQARPVSLYNSYVPPSLSPLCDGISAEHDEASSHHSGGALGLERFAKTESVDEVENDDSDSEGGEFITIKVTNEEGNTEAEEVDHIEKHRAK